MTSFDGSFQRRRLKRICEISIFPLAFLCMTSLLYQSVNNRFLGLVKTRKDELFVRPPSIPVRRFDVLLNSYMRAGSSFTGRLLGYRGDSFYWYEPLWNFNCVVYYRGKEEICSSDTHRCVNVAKPKTKVNLRYHSLSEMEEFLENIYNCNFSNVDKGVADGMTDVLSGNIWQPYSHCRKRNSSEKVCVLRMENFCRQANHRVTKVLRLSVDNLEKLLIFNPNLKIIHLFRDPRAVINSRLTTSWYYLKEDKNDTHYEAVRANADGLCRRMTYDLEAGIRLKNKFPTRFAFLLFEDIYSDVDKKVFDLYRYFGMSALDIRDKYLNITDIGKYEHTVVKKSNDFSCWWRTQMPLKAVKVIEDVCSAVFSVFPYIKLPNENLLRNVNFPHWKLEPLFDTQLLLN